MEKRTGGLIATIVTVLLCGCPGLFAACFGAIAAIASFVPAAEIDMLGNNDPTTALVTGGAAFCLGVIFIIIPIVVGFVTLRRKPAAASQPISDEPLPPAL